MHYSPWVCRWLDAFCRGDLKSVSMLNGCFTAFSSASGLVANTEKRSIYFGGVNVADHAATGQLLGFTKGSLP